MFRAMTCRLLEAHLQFGVDAVVGNAGGDLRLALGVEVADGIDEGGHPVLLDANELDVALEAGLGGGDVGAALRGVIG